MARKKQKKTKMATWTSRDTIVFAVIALVYLAAIFFSGGSVGLGIFVILSQLFLPRPPRLDRW